MQRHLFLITVGIGMYIASSGSTNFLPQNTGTPEHDYSYSADDPQKKEAAVKTSYTCSMHPGVIQDKPGKCPKCGMNLTAKEVKKSVYTCPMHPEIIRDKKEKCPKCGMNLELKEPAKKAASPKK